MNDYADFTRSVFSENPIMHRHQNAEMQFYNDVANGDLEAVRQNCREKRFLDKEGVGILSRDPLTNLKYHYIVSVAMITRFCVDKGMEMERAFRLSDYYIQKLDDIHKIELMGDLHERMVLDFTRRMKQVRQNAAMSRPINECMNYIYTHIRERITIEDLAEYTGNSTSYISRLFKDELGISTSDYIRNIKIEAAKNMLRFSDYSLIDIANYLAFSSQSHFSLIFQKQVGMTPKKYREQYYGTSWKDSDWEDEPE